MLLFRDGLVATWKMRARKANAGAAGANVNGFPAVLSVVAVATTREPKRLNRVVAETPMSGWLQVRAPRAKMRLPSPPVSNVKFRIVQRNSVAICRCARVGLVMRSRDATKVVNAAITSDRKAALIRTLVHRVRVRKETARKRDVQSAVSSVRMDARSVVPANASVQNCATRKAGL